MRKIKSIFKIRTVFLILAMVPVVVLILITINLVIGSSHAIGTLGFRLFSSQFSPSPETPPVFVNRLSYGLLPALWGTFMVVLIAMLFAFPVSMAFAILANDFSFGWINTLIRWIISFLSGIPPIIYAVMGSTFSSGSCGPNFRVRDYRLQVYPLPTCCLPMPAARCWEGSCCHY